MLGPNNYELPAPVANRWASKALGSDLNVSVRSTQQSRAGEQGQGRHCQGLALLRQSRAGRLLTGQDGVDQGWTGTAGQEVQLVLGAQCSHRYIRQNLLLLPHHHSTPSSLARSLVDVSRLDTSQFSLVSGPGHGQPGQQGGLVWLDPTAQSHILRVHQGNLNRLQSQAT